MVYGIRMAYHRGDAALDIVLSILDALQAIIPCAGVTPSQPANQPTSQPANQPTSQPTSQPANQPTNPPIEPIELQKECT